jgi:putative transposase
LGEYQRTLGFEEDGQEDRSYPLQRYGRYNTLNYNQSGFKIDQDHRLLHLSKIGDIRAKLYRKIEGYIKAVIMKREGKRWFAIVQTDPLNTTQSVLLAEPL